MASDGLVEIEVVLDDGTVVKRVQGIKKEIGGIGDETKKSSVSTGSLVKAFVGLEAVKKVVSGVSEGIKAGFNFNKEVETMKVGWSTILGGGKQAEQMVAKLNDYAKKTPFNTSDTDKMGKYLYNAGIEGDKMFSTMTQLGDVTSAYGGSAADAVEVTRQYAQVMQSGTAYTEDLNIMNDRGIPIYQAIAKQMGINVGEVKKMASQGKISSEIYANAVATMGDKVKGSMDKQSQTWTGMVSTFEDQFGQIMGTLTSPIFDVAKEALGGLLEYISTPEFMASVDGIAKGFANLVKESLPLVVSGFKTLMGVFQTLAPILPALVAGFTGFMIVYQIGQGIQAFNGWLNGMTLATKMATLAQGALNAVMALNPFTLVAIAIAGLVTAFVLLYQKNEGFRTSVIAVWNAIVSFLQPVITALTTFISNTWANVLTWWKQNQTDFKEALTIAWNFIQNVIKTVMGFLAPYIENTWTAIKAVVLAVWQGMKQVISGAIKVIQGIIEVVMSAIRGDWSGVWDGIKRILSGAWEIMKGVVSTAVKLILTVVITTFNNMKATATNIWNGLKTAIGSAIDGAKSLVGNAIDAIVDIVTSVGDIDLYSIGQDVIRGFINGLGSMGNWIKDTISGLVGDVTGWLASAFKIGSPSRLMRDEIGKWIPAGIGVGIEANADSAVDALATVKDKMMTSKQSALDFGGGLASTRGAGNTFGGTTTINNQPQITVQAEWYGKEDIRKTMQEINWLTEVDQRGAMA